MTVSYSSKVFTSTGHTGIFLKLLGRWRGSIYKLVWHDLLVYVVLYFFLSITYRFVLTPGMRLVFESVTLYCQNYANLIPVTFVLGFYVSLIIQRWWSQFESLPWPDSASVWISTYIHGHDERGRLMRRTIVRYLNLSLILSLRLICLPVKKRFPTLDHLVEAGILVEGEKKIIEKIDESSLHHPKYWMPLVWAGSIVTRARKEGRIKDDFALKGLIEKLDDYRGLNGTLLNYDWIPVPLVYTQVVTLAVYSFLLSTLMGSQFLDTTKNYKGYEVDLVVPVFTFLQFFFYMGWLKVAEALINPFGEDDDDFDMNWLIDRNLQVSYLIVDEMHSEYPDLIRDHFWDNIFPELPYTAAAEEFKTDTVIGGATNVEIAEEDAEFLPMFDNEDDDDDDDDDDDKNSKLGGIVIEIPASSANGVCRPATPHKPADFLDIKRKDHHNRLQLPTVGSAGTLASSKSGSKTSLVSSVLQRLVQGRGCGGLGGDPLHESQTQKLGSQNSLLSKNSKASRRQRRRPKINRSVSRISSCSQPQSPASTNADRLGRSGAANGVGAGTGGDQDDNYKMSSMSSLNSHLSEMSSVQNSKHDLRDLLKSDLSSFQRQHGVHQHGLRNVRSDNHLMRVPGEIRRGAMPASGIQAGSSVDHISHAQNKVLRQKLEALQSLQSDILNFLDMEIEEHEQHQVVGLEDPNDLVQSLEDKTDLLRRQLLRRSLAHRRPSEQCSSPVTTMPDQGAPVSEHHSELEAGQDGVGVGRSRTSLFNNSTELHSKIEEYTRSRTSSYNNPADLASSLDEYAGELVALEPANLDQNPATTGPGTPLAEEPILSETLVEQDPGTEGALGNDKPAADGAFETELSTIEEQPELGYQSDSSETEMLIPKLEIDKKKNLPTLVEEDKEAANC